METPVYCLQIKLKLRSADIRQLAESLSHPILGVSKFKMFCWEPVCIRIYDMIYNIYIYIYTYRYLMLESM